MKLILPSHYWHIWKCGLHLRYIIALNPGFLGKKRGYQISPYDTNYFPNLPTLESKTPIMTSFSQEEIRTGNLDLTSNPGSTANWGVSTLTAKWGMQTLEIFITHKCLVLQDRRPLFKIKTNSLKRVTQSTLTHYPLAQVSLSAEFAHFLTDSKGCHKTMGNLSSVVRRERSRRWGFSEGEAKSSGRPSWTRRKHRTLDRYLGGTGRKGRRRWSTKS